ncbi:MAG TPA: energy-coupling factor transporter transmembrane component T, partial [Bacillales bacterium]
MGRGFASFHPFTCFLYFVGTAMLVMLDRHPVFLLCGLIVLVLLNVVQNGGKALYRWYAGVLLLFLFFVIVNPLLNHKGSHILFYFSGNPIMLEAAIKGVTVALSLVCLLMMFISYNRVITADKFLFLFAKLIPKWALLAMLTMRFVPLL